MLISYNWLKQFTNLENISPQTLAERLTMHSVEVEDIISLGEHLDNIVVGKVESVQPHPNADTLNICTVSFGAAHPVQIVCGGSNVREGMLCALGLLGAKVRWHGEGELIELKKAKIRGAESYGMICASEEIGLGTLFPSTDEKEILDLSDFNLTVGTPLKEALGLNDVLIDVENKTMTHRPDLWGHYGLAREVSAIFQRALTPYIAPEITSQTNRSVTATINTEHCYRYMGVLIEGIQVKESPAWMREKLSAVGIAPKNNIVDITNYVMLELGQPLHAFDSERLCSPNGDISMNIRQAHPEETFTALGGREYILTSEDMVIACNNSVVALAGVKGDEFSGVKESTTAILLEAATFEPTSVRRTATRHGLRTDASARFEKSLDTNLAETALRRAVELVQTLCPEAIVTSNVADVITKSTTELLVDLDLTYLEQRMGITLPTTEVIATLERLGFGVVAEEQILHVTVPTWRATKDVSIQEDIIEEIARMYGYNKIPVTLPVANIAPPEVDALRETEKLLADTLAHELGYTEVYNYSFVAPEYIEKIGLSVSDHLELDNPVAKDRPFLRKYLFPNVLQNVEANLHRFDEVALFEIGKVFDSSKEGEVMRPHGDERLPLQETKCLAVFAAKGVDTPYFEMRYVLDRIAQRLNTKVSLTPVTALPTPWDSIIHPGRVANVLVGDTAVGTISEFHPSISEKLGIPHRVASLELNVSVLAQLSKQSVGYEPVPQYPSVTRDISFLVQQDVSHAAILAVLAAADDHVRDIVLLDVYTGEHVPKGEKSMAYRITYRSDEKTLETAAVDAMHEQVIKQLKNEFNVTVR